MNPREHNQSSPDPYPRKGLFTSLLLLYDIIYRQSPRDFVNRFSSLTQADLSPQGRRRRRVRNDALPFIDANDPHLRYTWNVYQALSQSSSLWFNALCQPVVRLRTGTGKSDPQVVYRTDPLQRILLSWATDRLRQDAWNILQKGYHPQLGLSIDWCSRLLLFSERTATDGEKEDWGDADILLDMHSWIQAQGGRIENRKVFPS